MAGPDPDPTSSVPGMAIWGWMLPVELEWLGARAAEMDSVVEIGCLHGRSAFALLTACPGTVYCIDPWDDDAGRAYPSFMGNCGHFPNLVAIPAASPGAAVAVPDVDMTFIDGSHTYEAVLADIAAWLPKTRRLICGHDFERTSGGFPGVREAAYAVFGEDRVSPAPGTAIWTVDLTADRSVRSDAPRGALDCTDEYGRDRSFQIEWPS